MVGSRAFGTGCVMGKVFFTQEAFDALLSFSFVCVTHPCDANSF